jgi:hypothetical protein
MQMLIPNEGEIEVLAQELIKHFPSNAADMAAQRSSAFLRMGYAGESKKWVLVRTEIEKLLRSGRQ